MKKHHYLLILLIVGIAAYLLNETRNLKAAESIVSEELNLLRQAVKKAPGLVNNSKPAAGQNRAPALDPTAFMAGLADILKGGSGLEQKPRIKEFLKVYEAQLRSAPVSKLKEICDLLEKTIPLEPADNEAVRFVWLGIVGLAAKSDPAWAFATFEQTASKINLPIHSQLDWLKSSTALEGEPMSLAYAGALQKWLDAAQAKGRLEGTELQVAELRAQIAAAQGDQSAAVKEISQLPNQRQRKAAIDYLKGLPTPDAQRCALEELSAVLDVHSFPHVVKSLTDQHGFDAAREILSSTSLAPENHDLAAASIAAAKIGPETKERAEWLLENLRSDDGRALGLFASSWAEANHAETANWINGLQPGPKRDAALQGFIPAAASIDGASAIDWALTVSDPLLRNQLYNEAFEKWRKSHAEQASEYSKSRPLDREAIKAASK